MKCVQGPRGRPPLQTQGREQGAGGECSAGGHLGATPLLLRSRLLCTWAPLHLSELALRVSRPAGGVTRNSPTQRPDPGALGALAPPRGAGQPALSCPLPQVRRLPVSLTKGFFLPLLWCKLSLPLSSTQWQAGFSCDKASTRVCQVRKRAPKISYSCGAREPWVSCALLSGP